MFRKMRRSDKAYSDELAKDILARNTSGVLAVLGDDDYPYAVPVNYDYHNGKLYFHGATAGHKIDAIAKHSKVSFCVVDSEEVDAAEFTTYYGSAIAFGHARVLGADEDAKQDALEALVKKFSPDYLEKGLEEIKSHWTATAVIEIEIDHLTAKGTPLK